MRRLIMTAIPGLLLLLAMPASALPLMTETISENFYFLPDGQSYKYASVIDFYDVQPDSRSNGIWLGDGPDGEPALTWTHSLPLGLGFFSDPTTSVKLWIDGAYISGNGSLVEMQGTWDWDPLNHIWQNDTFYNISNAGDPSAWFKGDLGLNLWAGGASLRIDQAVLVMDPASETPEPATLLLMSLGLLGGAACRKLRRK